MRVWRCGETRIALQRSLVMGVVNVTPDSFSDGGRFTGRDDVVDVGAAVAAGVRMAEEGATVLDVGGESTRPGAREVSVEEEARRVLEVVGRLAARGHVVSIDTRHADVARAALQAGASIVNDVSGFRDPAMVEVAASTGCGCVVMHMLGEPRDMQEDPRYDDVVAEVASYLSSRARELEAAGVERDRIALDPGIGFGKTLEHNLALLRRLPSIAEAGYPTVVGASRKRFIGLLTGGQADERLAGSLAAACWAAAHGADVVRVHDVAETVRALAVTDAITSSGTL